MASVRKFFSDQVSFTVAAVPDSQVDNNVIAYIFLNGATSPWNVLALVSGQISEEEFAPGDFRYNITNYEVPSTTTSIDVRWEGSVAGVPADNSPILTTPSITQMAVGDVLEVVSSSPAADATGVDPRTNIVLIFDENLDPNSLVAGQIFIQPAGSTQFMSVRAYINPDNLKQLVVKPLNKLSDSVIYQLVIPVLTLYGASGTRLGKDYKLRFTTGADSFNTVEQATDEGVVERAGPLILATPITPSTAPGLSASTPDDEQWNYGETTLTFIMSEDIDPNNSIPNLTIEVTPLFNRPKYYIGSVPNGRLWLRDDVDPTFPTDVIDGGGLKARGTITLDTNPLDGETLIIGDGVSTVTFEFDDDASVIGGNTAVTIGATAADTLTNLVTAIQSSVLTMTAVDNTAFEGTVTALLIHDTIGIVGNVAIGGVHASVTVSGMSGGVDSGPTPHTTVIISGDTVTVTLDIPPPGNAFVNVKLDGLVTLADPTVAFPEIDITYITELWPLRVPASSVRRAIRRYIAEDITDCDIAVLITQVSLDLWEIYKCEAVELQLCVIQSQVALMLLDDYIADSGLDGMKELGPFRVQNSSKAIMGNNGPYDRISKQLEACLRRLNAYFTRPLVGIKSSLNPLERPAERWRIRTWAYNNDLDPSFDENSARDRRSKLPPFGSLWS